MVKLVTDTNLTEAVNAAVATLVAGAPGALDTLNELATALGDDANFAATVTTALGNRLTWRGAWVAGTNYVTNDLVTFNGGLYRAPNNFTSGGAFVLANWVELYPQIGTYAAQVDDGQGQGGKLLTLGAAANSIAAGCQASAILSGGITGNPNKISGVVNYSTIHGGYDNDIQATSVGVIHVTGAHHRVTGTATHATISGGSSGTISAGDYGTIAGGTGHTVSAIGGTVSGGQNNTSSGTNSTVSGGSTNTASALYSTVSGGTANVASGNSSTISGGTTQNAYGTSSTIGGGNGNNVGSSGTPANGANGTIAGGASNSVGTTASAQYGTVAGGRLNQVQADYGTVPGGRENQVTGQNGHATGYGAVADKYGQQARASGYFAAAGDAQCSRLLLRRSTTDATQTELRLDGSAQRLSLSDTSSYLLKARIIGRRTDTRSPAQDIAWDFEGIATRESGAATVTYSSTRESTMNPSALTWALSVAADTTNGAIAIKVTGEAAKTILWNADVELLKVSG